MLDSFGAIILLVATVLYLSKLSETEKFYKSTMLLYSLGMLAASVLSETATVASLMRLPNSGFVDAALVPQLP